MREQNLAASAIDSAVKYGKEKTACRKIAESIKTFRRGGYLQTVFHAARLAAQGAALYERECQLAALAELDRESA